MNSPLLTLKLIISLVTSSLRSWNYMECSKDPIINHTVRLSMAKAHKQRPLSDRSFQRPIEQLPAAYLGEVNPLLYRQYYFLMGCWILDRKMILE